MEDIVILGYGGHGKSLVDSIKRMGQYNIIGYTDNSETLVDGIKYLGTDDDLANIKAQGVKCAAIGVGFLGKGKLRDKLYDRLVSLGYSLPIIIDPSAIISDDVQIGEGTFIGKGTIINAGARIGKMCIVNSGALVEHDCKVEDYTHVAVKACLCGEVSVGHHSHIGANATVLQCVDIGSEVIVAAGSVVLQNISDRKTYYGINRQQ